MNELQMRATNSERSVGYLAVDYNQYFEVGLAKALSSELQSMIEKSIDQIISIKCFDNLISSWMRVELRFCGNRNSYPDSITAGAGSACHGRRVSTG
jgi:hypothetical protein